MTEDYQWKAGIFSDAECTEGLVGTMLRVSPVIDLSTCVPGQKLRCRDDLLAEFIGPSCVSDYPFECKRHYSNGWASPPVFTYCQDGTFAKWMPGCDADIVEILPLEVISAGQIEHGDQVTPPAPTDKPLWELMESAYNDQPSYGEWREQDGCAAEIEAVRDFLAKHPWNPDWTSDVWHHRQYIHDLLTEQARIARGES